MYQDWNREKHYLRMARHVPALVRDLMKVQIMPLPDEGDNVVFTNGLKKMRIAKHIFYRVSGLCRITKDVGKHEVDWIEVTDEMYIIQFMGSQIKKYLKK